ncbi:probable E3 ubiquitin-protein ligase HIP1 isoform X1 [Dendrobium catenatum]|nr:probable E3 ubiquitin-protein ligase HIP1 isoform X1 [Dendrobium catenatum]XP_020684992.1 probable E3 ubiquitin-protein ligase HIP1 isoform X1 [Dendrobium catenatum]XP_020685001.1 probable E3 ubiquitin-protein ligase HIP1 isoform X1 [Dendrobium catenatum]XP_020685006.1 probable E3 ubiquitin-protein ligase HIP1 isoform X1 [Dendrobium catenatum]XP_028556374.1 probable E3 ubiquitin-protein ligase HIP1 isoform X1 [Dendrobium catenatum]XP_028556375.1 probable E3 ubiquitin-protein ligase HIP1 iso
MNRDNVWSHRLPDPCLNLGNCIFILAEENKAVGSASSSMAYHTLNSNTNFSSSSNSDLVNYRAANTGLSCDPHIHHSSVNRSCIIPHINTNGGSYDNQLEIRVSTNASNSEADYERAYFKRKSFSHPMALDGRNSDEYYSARSSNGVSISSDQYMPNPILGPHSLPHNSICLPPGYTSNRPLTIDEGSGCHRNVRSRHGLSLHMENNLIGPHASSSLSHHFHQTTSTSGDAAMPLDYGRRFLSSGFFHHEMNQPIASSGADADMEIAEGFSSNIVLSRHRATLVPTLAVIPMQDDINYGHRLNPYSSSSSYTTVGLPGTVGDARQFGNEVLPHLRHHRKSSILGQSSERYGRTRNSYDSLSYRMNALANEERAHGSWNDESAMMIDRSIFNDHHTMLDQHRNMRMDIDNMSYEELVDLGERIGNVSTGLSGGDMAKCLTSAIYSSGVIQDVDEGSCVICLEEYKEGQSIGRLNCRHDFHSRCIKKWLLIKNACPICKSAALGDKVKGKQVLLM